MVTINEKYSRLQCIQPFKVLHELLSTYCSIIQVLQINAAAEVNVADE